MRIEIDQSGKVEYTDKDTVLAFSNGKFRSIKIRAKEKRKVQLVFKKLKRPEMFVYKMFAVLVFLLVRETLNEIQTIVIDTEYTGKDDLIKTFLKRILIKSKRDFDVSNIYFKRLGRKVSCHKIAIEVYRKRRKPEMIVGFEQIIKYVL